ncbi:uncharacterized protein LOC120081071 [Benincasa hispida]|uniref:uncharacterized protein LOC120081071 n=1 Tax=Benincasa hispida TaxID=102211 RepID=UPI001901803A|nr:uncharacterized protein LOC120081071 [Benincasa hispida]
MRPPSPFSIQPLATIYPVASDASSQPPHSPIVISSSGSPHTPTDTPPFTPPRPPSDSPASERNLEELVELARLNEQEVFEAILASLNQGQEEEQVIHSDPPNASLELDEAERYAMMLEAELEEEERRFGPNASQSRQTDANEGPSKEKRVTRKRKLILEEEDEQSTSSPEDAMRGTCSRHDTLEKDLEEY